MMQGLAEGGRQSTALPIEIGFLAGYGHPPKVLRDAAMLAELIGVSPDTVLLKHGFVGELEFYRALAAELSLPFLTAPRLSPSARYPASILTGLAPLADAEGGFVAAPHGAVLSGLLKDRRRSGRSLAITAPSILMGAVLRMQAGRIAYYAARELPDATPDLSSHDGASAGQIAVAAAMALLLSSGGYLAPDAALAVLATVLSPLFFGMIVLRLAASILANPVEPVTHALRMDDAALPTYTVIVALYRERRILPRLIAALMRLDYPAAKLDIKLVLEADDRETLAALATIPLPGFIEVIVAPQGEPRTKPRALNVALPLARGLYTVVYDAEDVPDPGQLRLAAAALHRLPPEVACLQARLTIDNTDDSWLTRLYTIEYAALFDVFNPGLAVIGSPIALGGTSNHFRTFVLRKVHGWDAWNVTEDADLGIRLARLGYRVADLPSSTLEEAPITLGAWMNQRTRWMKGFVQTSISHSRRPWIALRQLGLWRFTGTLALTVSVVLSALGYPFLTGAFLVSWLNSDAWPIDTRWEALWRAGSSTLFMLGAAAIFIPACVALHRRRLWRLLPWVPILPLYYALVSIAAWRGLWELATVPFRWNKTSHGLARTSRTGLLLKHHARRAGTTSNG